jgi:hypothetical protein
MISVRDLKLLNGRPLWLSALIQITVKRPVPMLLQIRGFRNGVRVHLKQLRSSPQ